MNKDVQGIQLRNISWLDKLGYGSGNLGFGVVSQVIASYMVFYATAILDVPGSLIGVAMAIGVIWDGLTDPVMGYLSDITRLKGMGRRHLYLLVGTIGTVISNYLLWVIRPDLPMYLKFIWIVADLLIIKSFITIFGTPYTALGAELSSDYNERTTIQSIKMIFFLLGLFFATVMGMFLFFKPTPEFPVGQLNPAAYRNIGLASSILMLVFGFICFFQTFKYVPYLPQAISGKDGDKKGIMYMLKSFIEAFKNKDYKYVVLGYLFTNIASALASTIGLHVFTYTFNLDNNGIAAIIGTQFAASILSQPAWVWISKKFDKKPSVILGLILSIIGLAGFLAAVIFKDKVSGNFSYMLPYALLAGFGTGGLFSLPISMIADTIDLEEMNTGMRSEGTYYGCLTLCYKLSQSVAIFLLGIILELVKFDANLAVQPESTVMVLGLVLPVGSIFVMAAAVMSYRGYSLDRKKVLIIQQKIQENKAKVMEA